MTRKPDRHRSASRIAAADTTQSDMASLLRRLDQWLTRHRRRYAQGLLQGASSEEIEKGQIALGLPMPSELRALLAWHNGQSDDFIGHFESHWDLMSMDRIVEAKRDLNQDASETGWQPMWIPILETDAGDYLCLDTSQASVPVREFHLGTTRHPIVAPSLAAWLNAFITAVEQGRYHEDPERGAFLHD